jgi:hypothetical protein
MGPSGVHPSLPIYLIPEIRLDLSLFCKFANFSSPRAKIAPRGVTHKLKKMWAQTALMLLQVFSRNR